jgi:hypothetical protein
VTKPRKVPTVHLPLRPEQIHVLKGVLGDWLEESGEMDLVSGGVVSQSEVDVIKALHSQLKKLESSLITH